MGLWIHGNLARPLNCKPIHLFRPDRRRPESPIGELASPSCTGAVATRARLDFEIGPSVSCLMLTSKSSSSFSSASTSASSSLLLTRLRLGVARPFGLGLLTLLACCLSPAGSFCTSSITADVRPPTVMNVILVFLPSGCKTDPDRSKQQQVSHARLAPQRARRPTDQDKVGRLLGLAPPAREEPVLWKPVRVRVAVNRGLTHEPDLGVQARHVVRRQERGRVRRVQAGVIEDLIGNPVADAAEDLSGEGRKRVSWRGTRRAS